VRKSLLVATLLAGVAGSTFQSNAALAAGYTLSTIDIPGALLTSAAGINAGGTVVGYYTGNAGTVGFVDTAGSISTYTAPGASTTLSLGINDAGTFVSTVYNPVGASSGLVSNGTTVNFPGTTGVSQATGINNTGTVVGNYLDASFVQHGFIDIGGVFSTIDPAGSTFTSVNGINNLGTVVGGYTDGSGSSFGFSDANGVFTTIDVSLSTTTTVSGINDAGVIVGDYTDSSGVTHGFIDKSGVYSTIDFAGAISTDVLGINDAGKIVGTYVDAAGVQHGFIGTVPEPVSLVLLGTGIAGLALVRVRQRA